MSGELRPFPWEDDQEFVMARANYMACAYNAAVNYGTPRGHRKMGDLIRAINYYERVEGRVKLEFLKARGVIDGYMPCPRECEMRPGGLFHSEGLRERPQPSSQQGAPRPRSATSPSR